MTENEALQDGNHERIGPISDEAMDPTLEATPEREVRTKDLVLRKDEEECADTDPKAGQGSRIGVSDGSNGDTGLIVQECERAG